MYQSSSLYTPQISSSAVFILRRMAWAWGKPMTKTLNHTILGLVPKLDSAVICGACLDKRCKACPITFSQNIAADSSKGTYSV